MTSLAKKRKIKLRFKKSSTNSTIELLDLDYLTFQLTKNEEIVKCIEVTSNNCGLKQHIEAAWLTAFEAHFKENLIGAYNIISGTIFYKEESGSESYWSFLIETSGKNFALHIQEHKHSMLEGIGRGPASSTGTIET